MAVPLLTADQMTTNLRGFGIFISVVLVLIFFGIVYYIIQTVAIGSSSSIITIPSYDICNLVPSVSNKGTLLNVAPSFWTAQLFFFIGYLLTNAITLYNTTPYPGASDAKVKNRRDQTLTAIVLIVLITLALVFARSRTGCETVVGTFVAASIMIPLGVGWYYLASVCGAGNSDIFGIVSRILTPTAGPSATQVCINTAV